MELKSCDLSWSLVIPTYCRQETLLDSLPYVAHQTRKPREIVVVDSSPNAEDTRLMVATGLARQHPDITWIYVASQNRSAAIQRNEGVSLCTADIVFFIDDDCLMYPDYAEIILSVYEADTSRSLIGVAGLVTDEPPDERSTTRISGTRRPLWRRAAPFLRYKCWHVFNHFVLMNTALSHFYPYNGRFPDLPPPELDSPYRVAPTRVFGAGRATFPREAIAAARFDEGLTHYCAGEDLDVCYRVSSMGPLVMVFDALVCHLEHPSVRPDLLVIAMIRVTNHAYFIQKHNPGKAAVKVGYMFKLFRRIFAHLLFDVLQGKFSLPRVRGVLRAIGPTVQIFGMSPDNLETWYVRFQSQVYDAARR